MELDSIDKYIHMTKLANGVEVMFAGQPCLKIMEGDAYTWSIYPVFAKLTYGANIFEDVPYCLENFDTMEEAIADGLAKLHSLGAFVGEVDLPEDTYAESGVNESVEDLDEGWKEKIAGVAIGAAALGGVVAGIANSPMAHVAGQQIPMALSSNIPKDAKLVKDDSGKQIHVWSTPGHKGRPIQVYRHANKANESTNTSVSKLEITEELLDSILQDCRAYAAKHSSSIMEAHDLSLGLYESILSEADFSGVNADAKRQGKTHEQMAAEHRKYAANMRRVGQAGLASRSEALAKSHDAAAKVNEETLDEDFIDKLKKGALIASVVGVAALSGHQAIKQKQAIGSLEKQHSVLVQKNPAKAAILRDHINAAKEVSSKVPLASQHSVRQQHIDAAQNIANEETLDEAAEYMPGIHKVSAEVQDDETKKWSPTSFTARANSKTHALEKSKEVFGKRGRNFRNTKWQDYEPIDEAKALSGDAYWKSKEDAASEEKAKAARASAGIKEPEKKGRGKPTLGATVDEMKDRMRENIAAGKRPHTGFDRNEKLRILRSGAMEHPEFAGTHVKAAGRPVGTTKAAAIEKKKAEPTAFSMWAGLGKK